MPLDLRAIQSGREQNLSDFIGGIPGSAVNQGNKVRSLLDASRNSAFALTPDLVSQYGGAGAVAPVAGQTALRKGALGRVAESKIAGSQLNAQNDAIQKRYEQTLRIALQAGQSAQDAVVTARQAAMDEIQRIQTAAISEKNRQTATTKQDIADSFTKQGLAQESAYVIQPDYQAAVIRALAGLGGIGLTAYGLNKYHHRNDQNDLNLSRQSLMRDPTLNEAWTKSGNLTSPYVPPIDFSRYAGGQ